MFELIYLALSFLVGSIPFGYLVARYLRGVDIKKLGSGNIGATNVARVLGTGYGAAVLVLDAFKGALPVWVAADLFARPWMPMLSGVFAVLGHSFSPFLSFRGGKGVATSFGVVLVLYPVETLTAVALFALIVLLTRVVSVASLSAVAFMVVAVLTAPASGVYDRIFVLTAALVIYLRHLGNINRLLHGEEKPFGSGDGR